MCIYMYSCGTFSQFNYNMHDRKMTTKRVLGNNMKEQASQPTKTAELEKLITSVTHVI